MEDLAGGMQEGTYITAKTNGIVTEERPKQHQTKGIPPVITQEYKIINACVKVCRRNRTKKPNSQ